MLSKKLKQRDFFVNVLIWVFFVVILLWEPGESYALPEIMLYAAIGVVIGALQELFESVVVKAISIAILLSLIMGTRFGWIGAIIGVILGGLVAVVFNKVFAARRRGHDTSSRKPS